MKKTSVFSFFAALLLFVSCGGTTKDSNADSAVVNEEAFSASQPVESGIYDATRYDIQGPNARKGKFDGRVIFTISPEQSAFYVYENGNRTKIDYKVILGKPFEQGDSGIYRSVDVKGLPVTIVPDSADYVLNFEKGETKVAIGFDKKPRNTYSAVEAIERMNEQIQKKK
ncbi:hypothetical protein [Lepagella muris]|jgi:hypothetical protein|uniref:Uncharacterized protein n=1 Tax=Lepagella muris TaxID=3032870 RepID=A0AC61RF49_9BACT|nr:hypothetical protein [Lepagella muris]TGY77969.1 hypothetical protein E5331_12375 [Lepagella muris]THG51425.1 hypothetical protein E5984_11575 [Bacteroidales bacterium]TKC56396.1 hypothetical protein E5359_013590 [Bacteroidales bacterium]